MAVGTSDIQTDRTAVVPDGYNHLEHGLLASLGLPLNEHDL